MDLSYCETTTPRVLQVTSKLFQGGAETFIMNVYRAIDRSSVQFDFLVFHEGREHYEQEIEALGGRIYRIPVMDSGNFLAFRRNLDTFFAEHRNEYVAVHGHMAALGNVYLKAAERANIGIRIAHSHTAGFDKTPRGVVKHVLNMTFGRHSTHRLACSCAAGDYMFGNYNYSVVKNGIDIQKFQYNPQSRRMIRDQLGIPCESFVIGHVGRFEIEKNQAFLIELLGKAIETEPNTILVLIGDGLTKKKVQQLVQDKGLSGHVIFTGLVDNTSEYYSAFDVLVMPSLYEGLPFTAVEAQCSGLPCVLSSTISHEAQLADNVTYLSLDEDIQKWVEATQLSAVSNNEERLLGACRIADAGFDISATADELTKIYLNEIEE